MADEDEQTPETEAHEPAHEPDDSHLYPDRLPYETGTPTGLASAETIAKLKRASLILLGVLLVIDPWILETIHVLPHDPHHEAHFFIGEIGIDVLPEFYAVYGFITCVAMVVVSKKLIGKLLMRPDTYYDHSPLNPTRDAKGRRIRK